MKLAIVVLTLMIAGCCLGQFRPPASISPGQQIRILKQEQEVNFDGSYQWSYETENGISAQEQGVLKNAGSQEPIQEAQGSFQYTAPDGTPIQLQYLANENGFVPSGAHLPVAPPIPAAIQRALEWNAAHPEEDDGGAGRRRL